MYINVGYLLVNKIYVDDMLNVWSNRVEIGKLMRNLHNKFTMKEVGQAEHILGM